MLRKVTNFESFVTNTGAHGLFLLPTVTLVQNWGKLGLGGHAHRR